MAYDGDSAVVKEQFDGLNATKVIYARDDDYIVVVGLIDLTYEQTVGTVTVERSVPEMDYVCEAQNRVWGCKYGMVDGKAVNELYCCALGDFKNWNRFLGISTDAWAASVGSDGAWTGAANYLGLPHVFQGERDPPDRHQFCGHPSGDGDGGARRTERQQQEPVRGKRGAVLQGPRGCMRL